MADLTEEQANKYFTYDEEAGKLLWKVDKGRARVGHVAGWIDRRGYRVVKIEGKLYKIHRLVYLINKGYLPKILDHINNDRADNRIENLRPVNSCQNSQNSRIRLDNTSGIKGVYLHKPTKKWFARVQAFGKRKHIGRFNTLEEAGQAIAKARENLHGEYTNHGGTI